MNDLTISYVKDKIYTINHSKYTYEEESFDTEVSNEQRDYILSLIEGDLG